ncbi:hypothetical protein OG250_15820 [Streptomyces sp. NBC_00487]|nr:MULTISPECIES: hypothetical protein [unclassified Streptomyces]
MPAHAQPVDFTAEHTSESTAEHASEFTAVSTAVFTKGKTHS